MLSGFYSVLTGDIVNFTNYSIDDRKSIISKLENLQMVLPTDLRREINYLQVQTFRGDSWQVVVNNPSKSLRVSTYIRAYLKSVVKDNNFDTRISIGISKLDSNFYLGDSSTMSGDGQAFRLSGHGIDALSKTNERMSILFDEDNNTNQIELVRAVVKLMDFVIINWTYKQSYLVTKLMDGLSNREIASDWIDGEISSSAVSQHIRKSGWERVNYALKQFEIAVDKKLYY